MLLLLALQLALGTTSAAPSAELEGYERQIREQLRAQAPGVVDAFNRASHEREAGDSVPAKRDFEIVLRAAPNFAPAHRRLASVLSQLEEWQSAREHAETAVKLDASAYSHATLASILLAGPNPDLDLAQSHVRTALQLKPEEPQALFLNGYLAMRRGDRATLQESIALLHENREGKAGYHQLATFAALLDEEVSRALDEASAAEAAGASGFFKRIRSAIPTPLLIWIYAKRYGPIGLVAWAGILGILFLVGRRSNAQRA